MSLRSDGIYLDESYKLIYPEGARQTDGIPEDLNEIVDPHWRKFPPQHPFVRDIGAVVYLIFFFVNLFGNSIVLYVFCKTKTLRTPTNMFIANLAIADMLMMFTQGPPITINIFFFGKFWAFGKLACQLYGFMGGVFGTINILTMVIIGYDRYNVIVKGFSGVKITKVKAFLIILAIWTYSVCVCMPPFLGWGGYAFEGILLTCSYDYLKRDWNNLTFMYYAFVFNFTVPMILLVFFYVQIAKAVIMHEAALKAQAKKMNVESLRSKEQEGESAEVKIAKVAMTNVLLWLATWLPYAVVPFIAVFGNQALITPMVAQIPSMMTKFTSCFNPLIFGFSHPKFREAVANEIPCLGGNAKADAKKDGGQTVAVTAA